MSAGGQAGMIIESLGYYLPPRAVSTAEIAAGCARPLRFPLERVTGIRSRRMAGEQEFAIDLGRKAALDCLSRSSWRPDEIDLLISCTIARFDSYNSVYFEPSTASRLAAELGMTRARTFDLSNACAGMFTGLAVARWLLAQGWGRNALVLSGEYITHLTVSAQQEIDDFLDPRLACLTLGDAGAAALVEPCDADEEHGFQALDLMTLGEHSNLCVAAASRAPSGGAIMYTDSVSIAAAMVKNGVAHASMVHERTGIPVDAFDWMVPHQTSEGTLREGASFANAHYGREVLHEGNLVVNLAERGNTSSNSHFVATMDWIRRGLLRSGDRVIYGVSGSGITIGTVIHTFDDLPDRVREGRAAAPRPRKDPVPLARVGPPRVRIVGVGQVLGPGETVPMSTAACAAALADAGVEATQVGLLIHSGLYRTDFLCEPALASMIAGELEMNHMVPVDSPTRTLAFDILNGATGTLDATEIAAERVAGTGELALVVASEVENNPPDVAQGRYPLVEGAVAWLLAPAQGDSGFLGFLSRRLPEHRDALRCNSDQSESGFLIRVRRDPALDELLLAPLPGLVGELLAAAGRSLDEVDVVLGPQVSRQWLDKLATTLGLPSERLVDITRPEGDWLTGSLPAAWRQAEAEGRLKPGALVLMIAAGSGLTLSAALYRV